MRSHARSKLVRFNSMVLSLIVLHVCDRLELSIRSIAALLIGAWGATCIAGALQPHEAYTLDDIVGPLGVALWIGQAVARHRHVAMRRASDWLETPGVRLAYRHPDSPRRP